jgi:signal transduction histidine kinase
MFSGQITHQNIFRVLIAGFALVLSLLGAAALFGIRNIESIQGNAADLLREQAVTNRLVDELHAQQTTLTEVFSVLARDPDSVDYDRILAQLDQADRDIGRISAEGSQTEDRRLWLRLQQTAADFSQEARRLLTSDNVETYATVDLFRDHEAFISVIAHLMEAEYRKVRAAQAQIDGRSKRLYEASLVFALTAILLAVAFAIVTIRMVTQLIRRLEWQTAELSRVSWHMLENQEAVARRFSHELHDELGQSLTAVKTNLAALDASGVPHRERVEECLRLIDESIRNVRQMSQLLRPTILDDFGLEAGLRWLCDGFAARTGIEVSFSSTCSSRMADETETHLYRIAQEALTNIARHSGAKRVEIRLERAGEDVRLTIRDDGRGLPDPAHPNSRGLGMIGMRARARSAGGDLIVRSRPQQGVLIEVRVPIRNETHSHSVG